MSPFHLRLRQRLCEAVRVNRSLRTLELPDNRITDDGAADVALLLHGNARLTTLSLACNRIGDVGAALIAQVRFFGGGGNVRYAVSNMAVSVV
jgi:hypothetical protein